MNTRGGSRTAATSKMECFVIIVNGFQPLTIITMITKRSILDVAAVLDPSLNTPQEVFYKKFAIQEIDISGVAGLCLK